MESVRDGGRVRSRAHRRRAVHRRGRRTLPGRGAPARGRARSPARGRGPRGRRRRARRRAGRRGGRSCGCGRRRPARSPAGSRRCARATRYIATWRGQATRAAAAGREELVALRAPKAAAVRSWIRSGEGDGTSPLPTAPPRPLRAPPGRGRRAPRRRGRGRSRGRSARRRRRRGSARPRARGRSSVTRSAISSSDGLVLERDAVVRDALAQDGHARRAGRAARCRRRGRPRSARAGGPRAPSRSRGTRSEVSTSWLPRRLERVEGVEELLLGLRLLLEELDVVDEQHVDWR